MCRGRCAVLVSRVYVAVEQRAYPLGHVAGANMARAAYCGRVRALGAGVTPLILCIIFAAFCAAAARAALDDDDII